MNISRKTFCVLVGSLLSQSLLAAPFFSPYVAMTVNAINNEDLAPPDLVKISQQTGVKSYNLAFVIDGGSCRPAWDGQYTTSSGWAKDLTDRMRAAGIQYVVSFGGAAGNDISKSCSQQQLLSAYQQIINTYQPNGLDFDIENGSANVSKIMTALKTIQATYPNVKISFTLPVMPTGLGSDGQNVVKQAKAANLNNYVVNIMAMDYGSSYRGDMGKYATQAATATFNFLKGQYPQTPTQQLWQMVQVTPMIGVNDVRGETFTLSNADTLRTFVEQNSAYGVSMWSLNRDKPCGGTFPRPTCSGGNVQSQNFQFSGRFIK